MAFNKFPANSTQRKPGRKNIIDYLGWGFALLIALAVLIFISLKASVSSFTHDESYTYLLYVHKSFKHIVAHADSYTNNHLLNTLGMKISEILFGCSEVILRLPNLLLFIVYLVYSFLLLKKYNVLIAVPVFVLLVSNSILVDFFGLARGYGMSIGFMMMSLYHLTYALESPKKIHLYLFNFAALLATLSNFTLLNFYFAGLLSFNIIKAVEYRINPEKHFNFIKLNKTNFILFLVNFVILYEPVRRVIKFNKLDFGGKANFYDDTINALARISTSNADIPNLSLWFIKLAFLLLILFPFYLIIKNYIRRKHIFFESNRPLILTNLIFLGISAASIIQHYLFGTDYMRDRFALFLIPLFILNTGYLIHNYSYSKAKYAVIILAIGLAIGSSVKFYTIANLHACAMWGYDMDTKHALLTLKDYHSKHPGGDKKVKLSVNWLFEPTANFYRITNNMDWLEEVQRFEAGSNMDYYFDYRTELDKLKLEEYDVIADFERTATLLIRNKKPGP